MKKIIKILSFLIFILLTNSCMVEYDGWVRPNNYDYYHSPYYFHGYPYYGYPYYYGHPYYNRPYYYVPPKPNHNHTPKPKTHYGPRR